MELTLTLPDHVAAGFTDADEATGWLLAQATEHAKRIALEVASDEAQALYRAAAAPFDGDPAPTEQTLAQRVEQIATNAVILGTRLAVEAAGGDPGQVAQIVSEVVGESSG